MVEAISTFPRLEIFDFEMWALFFSMGIAFPFRSKLAKILCVLFRFRIKKNRVINICRTNRYEGTEGEDMLNKILNDFRNNDKSRF